MSHKKILFLEVIMLITLWLATINNVMNNNIFYSIYLLIIVILSYFLVGFEKEEEINRLDIIRIVFVYTVVYLMAIYIVGFFIGFVRNPYSNEFMKIVYNIFFPLIGIILEELIRYNVTKKSSNNKSLIVLITIILMLNTISRGFNLYPLNNAMDVFNMVALLIVPAITRNIVLSYIAYKGFYKINVLYRVIVELNPFILPIYPNIGVYLESIFAIAIPTSIYFSISNIYNRNEAKSNAPLLQKIIFGCSIAFLSIMIILISGKTRYSAMAVGSGSMEPAIKVADAVIIKQEKEFEIGDILLHEHSGKLILHRIIKKEQVFDDFCYYTKGDANEAEDNYLICEEDIRGKVISRIPLIGYPSVLLERTLSKR